MKKGACIIVSAGDVPSRLWINKEEGDFVIAADAGYRALADAGIEPDVFVGDGDSLGTIPDSCEAVKLPEIKDDTDTVAAVKLGFDRGYRRFILYGALGGKRFSHSVANLQTLSYIDSRGGVGMILDDDCTVTVLSRENHPKFHIRGDDGYFSLFALGEDAEVSISSAKYESDSVRISPSFPLGVSNEPRGDCLVTVRSGRVLLVSERDPGKND